MKTVFDDSWKDWIDTNIDRGCCRDGIFKILLDEGYSYDAIREQMNYEPQVPVQQVKNPLTVKEAANKKVQTSGASISRDQIFIPNAVRHEDERVELYQLENFLNQDECSKLIDRIKKRLQPSGLSSYEADEAYRTSQTCFLEVLNDEFVSEIDDRICKMLGVDVSYSESIQGQYYQEGQEFKAHTDFFEVNEIGQHGGQQGQRTYTFMIYLNDVEEGGETEFTNLGCSFRPKLGTAVIWSNLNSDGTVNANTMHHAHKVKKGYKAIITKWFRSGSNKQPVPPMFIKEVNEFVPNYTKEGMFKTRLPEALFEKISTFYNDSKSKSAKEFVAGDFIYSEKDKKKTSSSLIDLSPSLRAEIHDAMKPLMEEWCGENLDPTYVYGIRIYHDAAVLRSHRDRVETHIISAIINVDQEVSEDWPLVIEDNYYRTHHVILKPGDMVFYEGARLKHGRPIAFNGRSFANIFCHFKPIEYIPKTRIS